MYIVYKECAVIGKWDDFAEMGTRYIEYKYMLKEAIILWIIYNVHCTIRAYIRHFNLTKSSLIDINYVVILRCSLTFYLCHNVFHSL